MDDDTREFKQLLFEALARADRIDFPKTNADTFVLEAARKLFLAQGEVPGAQQLDFLEDIESCPW